MLQRRIHHSRAVGRRAAQQLRLVENGVIEIGARDLAFTQPCMVANAGEAFTIHFVNADSMPHDVAIYNDSSKSNEIMRGEVQPGQREIDYEVEALMRASTTDCTIHPADMNGTLRGGGLEPPSPPRAGRAR